MRIEVFNVGHGQCAVITAPNGRRMMLDCGDRWGDDRFWTPSLHFFRQTIDLLGLMNLDEDHLSDFKNVMHDCTVPWILSNPTVGSREFALLKKDGMGPGAQAVAAWLAQPKSPLAGLQPDFGDVQIRWYYPFFIPAAANKTNDLSLAVIVQFGTFKILFAGDLEVGGWRRLLTIPAFRQDVQGVSVFVASHHGRESGCCTELFEWLRPQLVIISDSERQYDSQDTDDWYRTRCSGAVFVTNERRYVATTRNDGSMRIDVTADGRWTIQRVTVRDWLRSTTPSQPQLDLGALAALSLGQNPLAPSLTGPLSH
jgi:beta-lactamase superfamily II metal-dependent hydrolase